MLQERLWDSEAERLGGFEVDDEFEFGRQLNRQLARLGALEDQIDVRGRSAVCVGQINSVRHKAAAAGEEAIRIDRWQAMAGRQGDDEVAIEDGDDIRRYDKGAVRLLRERIDGAFDLGSVAHGGEAQLHAE